MKVKIIHTDNFRNTYIVLREEGDLFHYFDREGNLVQAKKNKMSLDKEFWMDWEEVYRIKDENHVNLTNEQLQAMLKIQCQNEKEEVEKMLHLNLLPYNRSHICFEDEKNDFHGLFYYGQFDKEKHSCQLEIYDHHLEFLQRAQYKFLVFSVEEFGSFYLNGDAFIQYLEKMPSRKSKNQKYWIINIDYDQLIRVKGHPTFHEYSNDISYLNKIFRSNGQINGRKIWSKLPIRDGHQLNLSSTPQLVDINGVREAQRLFKELKTKRSGFRIVRGPIKKLQK